MSGRIKKLLSGSDVRDIWNWSRGHRLAVALLSLGNVLVAGMTLAFSLATRELVDSAVASDAVGIKKFGVVLLGIILVQLVLAWLLNLLQLSTRARLLMSLRQMTLNRLLGKRYADVSRYHSGELVNRMFSDVSVVVDGVTGIIPPLASMLTQMIGAVVILMRLDLRFVAILAAVAFASFIAALLLRRKSKRLHREMQEAEGGVHSVMQETLENLRLIKASGSEERMEEQAGIRQRTHFLAQLRRGKFSAGASSGLNLVFRASWLYALIWGCAGIFNHTMSYGTLTAIMQLVGQVQGPFVSLSGTMSRIYSAAASAERLSELFALPDEPHDEAAVSDPSEIYSSLREIRLDNVSFSYGRSDILRDVSISVRPGDFTAVTGLSGAGKSTLFLLLLGIYQPTSGSVRFVTNGGDLPAGEATRGLFAYVPQGNALFSGTLRENITMFSQGASDPDILAACDAACIGDFVRSLSDGLDTAIGEHGIGLSEGQAQRIAIARAILSGAPVLLLDEATSALDETNEAQLLRSISALENRTCLIVTHRPAALSICGRRLEINGGTVTEHILNNQGI